MISARLDDSSRVSPDPDIKENLIRSQNIASKPPRMNIADINLMQELSKARRIDASFLVAGNRNLDKTPDEALNRHVSDTTHRVTKNFYLSYITNLLRHVALMTNR